MATKEMNHPLIEHKMSILRDKNTSSKQFSEAMKEISSLLAYEVFKKAELINVEISTPLQKTNVKKLSKKVTFVPILRAGLGMISAFKNMVPVSSTGHIGVYRDEQTLQPTEYLIKLSNNIIKTDTYVLDPMLATGNSASYAIDILKKKGCKKITFVCILACPEGLKFLEEKHPDVDIYVAKIDEKLNDDGFIVPGLGDAGDRIFHDD